MAKRKKSGKPVTRKRRKPGKKKNLKYLWYFLLPVGIGAFFIFRYLKETQRETATHFSKIIPKGYASVGIDVSHHQGAIDWEELMINRHFDTIIDFVYCKVTEGTDHLDSQYDANRKWLNDFGIYNGAYHYFKPKSLPRPQAEHFLAHWKKRDIDLPPVIDVEEEGFSDDDLVAKMKIWMEEVEKASGMRPVIYTSLNFYETKFRGKFPGYQFWIAAYSRIPEYMFDPEVIHWQFTESANLPGTEEPVDINVSKIGY